MNLELEADKAATEAAISTDTWRRFRQSINRLKVHHSGMYHHSLRVGLYAYGIAASEKWPDLALPLLGGCGHDLGKCRIPASVLDSTATLTEAEWALIARHPEDGYLMLKDEFPLTAMVAGLHHAFSPRAYGVSTSDTPAWVREPVRGFVIDSTMVVMIADVFDAMTTRKNASTRVDPNDIEAVRVHLGELFGDWPTRVGWLADHLI